jgi:hypothetical protein
LPIDAKQCHLNGQILLMLPKAMALVLALKITARVKGRLQQTGFSGAPRHDVVDLESDAGPEKQGQRNDVGGVEREVAQRADLEG